MNFKQFLIENTDPIFDIDFSNLDKEWQETVDIIKRDCQPFLRECKKLPLYRGIVLNRDFYTNKTKNLIEIKTKKKRKPIDYQDAEINYLYVFDKAFENVYGVKNVRSEHVAFTKGSYPPGYGTAFLIFPIGKFTYWWGPEVKTGYELYHKNFQFPLSTLNSVPNDVNPLDNPELMNTLDSQIEEFTKVIKNADYQNAGLYSAIRRGCEIMVKVDRYYAIRIEDYFGDIYIAEKTFKTFMRLLY